LPSTRICIPPMRAKRTPSGPVSVTATLSGTALEGLATSKRSRAARRTDDPLSNHFPLPAAIIARSGAAPEAGAAKDWAGFGCECAMRVPERNLEAWHETARRILAEADPTDESIYGFRALERILDVLAQGRKAAKARAEGGA
jgi:hypothetical protein